MATLPTLRAWYNSAKVVMELLIKLCLINYVFGNKWKKRICHNASSNIILYLHFNVVVNKPRRGATDFQSNSILCSVKSWWKLGNPGLDRSLGVSCLPLHLPNSRSQLPAFVQVTCYVSETKDDFTLSSIGFPNFHQLQTLRKTSIILIILNLWLDSAPIQNSPWVGLDLFLSHSSSAAFRKINDTSIVPQVSKGGCQFPSGGPSDWLPVWIWNPHNNNNSNNNSAIYVYCYSVEVGLMTPTNLHAGGTAGPTSRSGRNRVDLV